MTIVPSYQQRRHGHRHHGLLRVWPLPQRQQLLHRTQRIPEVHGAEWDQKKVLGSWPNTFGFTAVAPDTGYSGKYVVNSAHVAASSAGLTRVLSWAKGTPVAAHRPSLGSSPIFSARFARSCARLPELHLLRESAVFLWLLHLSTSCVPPERNESPAPTRLLCPLSS